MHRCSTLAYGCQTVSMYGWFSKDLIEAHHAIMTSSRCRTLYSHKQGDVQGTELVDCLTPLVLVQHRPVWLANETARYIMIIHLESHLDMPQWQPFYTNDHLKHLRFWS